MYFGQSFSALGHVVVVLVWFLLYEKLFVGLGFIPVRMSHFYVKTVH